MADHEETQSQVNGGTSSNPYRSPNARNERIKRRSPNRLLWLYVIPFCISNVVMPAVAVAAAPTNPSPPAEMLAIMLGFFVTCLAGLFYGAVYSYCTRTFFPAASVDREPMSHSFSCAFGQLIWFVLSLIPTTLLLPTILEQLL